MGCNYYKKIFTVFREKLLSVSRKIGLPWPVSIGKIFFIEQDGVAKGLFALESAQPM
jgi:hypothetical protein